MKWFVSGLIRFIAGALSENKEEPSSGRMLNAWAVFWFVLVMAWGFVVVVMFYHELILAYLGVLSGLVTLLLVNQTAKKKIEMDNK